MNTESGLGVAQDLNVSSVVEQEGSVLKLVKASSEVREEQLSFFKGKPRRMRVMLSPRDLEVLEFIIDMKFAGLNEVFEKFFSRVGSDRTVTSSTEWTRKRLRQIEAAGLLRADVGIGLRERVYFATFKGFYAVNSIHPEKMLAKPTGGLDLRTFVHDRELLLVRLEFERKFEKLLWISDRKLRQGQGPNLGFTSEYVPDALIELPGVGNVALEIEIALKSRARYRDKVQRYVRIMRESRGRPDGLKRVIFRCLKRPCFDAITKECDLYGEMFDVSFVPSLSGIEGGAK